MVLFPIGHRAQSVVPQVDCILDFFLARFRIFQKPLDVMDHTFQNMPLYHLISHPTPNSPFQIINVLCSHFKSNWYGYLCFIQISNIINKGAIMSYMNKSKTGRTSQSGYHCMRQSIETGMSHGKSFVHGITGFKIFWIIISSIPWHIPLPGTLLIHVSDAAAFPATKLLQRQSRYIFMREAQLIHLSYHIQMKPLDADSPGLFHQHSGTMSQGTATGIIAHSMFPGPDNSDTGIPDQFHSPMGNVCPRAQNQYRDSSGGKINNAVFICYSNGSISSVDDCMVHINESHTVSNPRKCVQFRLFNARDICH